MLLNVRGNNRPLPARFAYTYQVVDYRQAVAIGVYSGGDYYARVFGANEGAKAEAFAQRSRRGGVLALQRWINVPAGARELWVCDAGRPSGVSPNRFYGALGGAE